MGDEQLVLLDDVALTTQSTPPTVAAIKMTSNRLGLRRDWRRRLTRGVHF